MINALISLNADLASSIAFRYSCRLMKFVDMRLQAMHVEEVAKDEFPPGSGWVRSTWEKGLLQAAQEEIAQLINAEKPHCAPMDNTIIRIGNREDELLRELEENRYDLLLEGALNAFDAQHFHKKIHSKLYKYMPCPILLIKNLVDPSQAALIVGDIEDVHPLVATFTRLFEKTQIKLDLVFFSDKPAGQAEIRTRLSEAPHPLQQRAAQVLDAARGALAGHGWTPQDSWVVQNKPQKIGEMLGDYGLVGAYLPSAASRKHFAMDLLSRIPTATLLCKP